MTAIETVKLPFLNISFRRDLGILFTRWGQSVSLPQYIEGYTKTLQVAKIQDAHFWLVDLRQRNTPDSQLVAWYENEFIPAVKSSIEGIAYLAYLVSPLQLQKVPTPATPDTPVNLDNSIMASCFTIEQEAISWLNSCRAISSVAKNTY